MSSQHGFLTSALSALSLLSVLAGCARSRPPLPGDSVESDGAVTLSPPRFSSAPGEAREPEAREPLGAIESKLFPPELVMDHQNELGIDAAQSKAFLKEVERGQTEMLRLQWELQGEKEKLVKLLEPERVDESKVKESAARVMERENRIKASHLSMLVRVKNLLTADQQRKLRELREGPRRRPDTRPGARDASP